MDTTTKNLYSSMTEKQRKEEMQSLRHQELKIKSEIQARGMRIRALEESALEIDDPLNAGIEPFLEISSSIAEEELEIDRLAIQQHFVREKYFFLDGIDRAIAHERAMQLILDNMREHPNPGGWK